MPPRTKKSGACKKYAETPSSTNDYYYMFKTRIKQEYEKCPKNDNFDLYL